MSRDMFLQSAFQFGFYRREKPKFISFPVKFPADRSKFQFYTTARELYCLVCVFFSKSSGRNNDTYAFQYTFKNNTTQ